jgi:hypothetical protein
MRRLIACGFVCLAAICLRSSALAAEVVIKSMTTVPYTEVTTPKTLLGLDTGVKQTLKPAKGNVLLHVTFDVEVTWDAETEFLDFEEQDTVQLTAGDATGAFRGQVSGGEVHFSESLYVGMFRPFEWEEKKEPSTSTHNGFWEVPQGTKEVTLKLGDKSAKTKVVGEPKSFAQVGDVAVEVVGVRRLAEIKQEIGYENKFVTTLTNEGGSLLEVKLKLTSQAKGKEQQQQFWENLLLNRFFLAFGRGGRATLLGQLDSEKFTDASGFWLYPDDPSQPQTVTLYYPIPSNLTSFDVYYFSRPVAKGKIESLGAE